MAGKKQTAEISNKVKIKCVLCGKEKGIREYYSSNKGEHIVLQNKAPYCKSCVTNMICDSITGQISRDGFIKFLALVDRPMIPEIYKDVVPISTANNLVSNYINRLNLKGYKDLIYADTERFSETLSINSKKDNDNSEEFTDEDKKSQLDTIRLLGYDPFDGYDITDKKYMYNDLIPFLDEDTLEDQYKVNVILQIVNNNNQIRKMDLVINRLSSNADTLLKNNNDIKQLTAIKKNLNDQNDKLSKENNIALKHRGGSNSKNSTLGSMMKNLRELGFEKAEHDYYDMQKAYGMQVSADISNKSIMQILHFDDADMNNMFKSQREELQKLQNSELDLKEQIRLLAIENKQLKEKIKEFENK